MGATRPASGIKERLTDRHVISAVCESLFSSILTFALMPDASRVGIKAKAHRQVCNYHCL